MRRGAESAASLRPWFFFRCVNSSSFASSLMTSSGPPTLMPASSSCSRSRSTGTFSTFAKSATVTSDMRPTSAVLRLLLLLEPVRARGHDELGRPLGVEPGDLGEIVDGLLGQILAGHYPAARKLESECLVHTFEAQEILGGRRLIDDLFADERLRNQHVARSRAQLVDDLGRELLDARELASRNVGDLLERGETLLHQDVRDVLVDVELFHEVLDERARFLVALLLGGGLRHDVQLPAGELACEADVLPAA